MRINLTKKEIINSLYMQIGLSKRILDTILEDILNIIVESLKNKKKLKYLILVLLKYDIKKREKVEILKRKKKK